MAELNRLRKGQTITEHIDIINENVNVVNKDLEKVKDDLDNYVKSVNGEKGEVQLDAVKVGAFPNSTDIRELDIDNIKDTGVYIGTNANKSYYLIVIKYDNGNVYQELIGANSKKYRRFTGTWSEWISAYSKENPVSASDITGINVFDENKEIELALLNDGTFVKANLTLNPSTQTLKIGDKEFASVEYVDNAVNMIKSVIVSELPETGVENTIYFVPNTSEETSNDFNEWIWVNDEWEIIGGSSIDLTPFLPRDEASETYATKQENDGKVSKTTTINNKPLSDNITLTAEDVGALPSDTKIETNAVKKFTNEEITTKLSKGKFVIGDTFVVLDDGDYAKGHIYVYNASGLTDISEFVEISSDQSIGGVKNFTGVLNYLGEEVAIKKDTMTTNTQQYIDGYKIFRGGVGIGDSSDLKWRIATASDGSLYLMNGTGSLTYSNMFSFLPDGRIGEYNRSTGETKTFATLSDLSNYYTKTEVLNALYPIGTIYLTTSTNGVGSSSPASWLGGTWERLPEGYSLWTASSGAGGTIGAGLPNITGYLGGDNSEAYRFRGNRVQSGALYTNEWTSSKYTGNNSFNGYNAQTINFDASRSNSIYGASSTVQPPAYKVYAWRRTA